MAETGELTNHQTAVELGLLEAEFDMICEQLGRVPNFTELSVYSVMWSEHCSYKNSIKWLKILPKEGKHILAAAGEENAGLVDIGDGIACAFKIESHNHPSAIEPYQGAATGVGGIHRDIFTMGARPIAALNSLRFGEIDLDKSQWIMKGVVKGIGDYGNSFGVPTIAGETYFDSCYNTNPLVNAMSVGIVDTDKTVSAIAKGIGNPVYIVGSATGKDGIHGAAFASKDITVDSANDLPAVQVGDPFQEKLLLEATLEAIDTGKIVGMQDMGAAGIACSTSEMSEKGKVGMRIDLDKVPTRQKNMQPFEMLLSESQERMLIVVEKGFEQEVEQVYKKWDVQCSQIGEVRPEEENIKFLMNGEIVAVIPAYSLVLGGGAPQYDREYHEASYLKEIKAFDQSKIEEPEDLEEIAISLIENENINGKSWIYEQYDSMVQANTLSTNKQSDAGVVRVERSNKAIASTVDCNPYYIYADPEKGTQIAVAEAARNLVCSGAEPLAISNCLNFGNPYNPEVYWQFVGAIKGMKAACEKFNTPVTGGNVSFYNQSHNEGAVMPTPVIGMIGLIHNIKNHTGIGFQNEGDLIYMLGESRNDIAGSQYLRSIHGVKNSPCPYFNLDEEYRLQSALRELIKLGLINSAHDVSEGGLFVSLIEKSINSGIGFEVGSSTQIRKDAYWFGESQSRVVVSISPENQTSFEKHLIESEQKFSLLGIVAGADANIDGESWGEIKDFQKKYFSSFRERVRELS